MTTDIEQVTTAIAEFDRVGAGLAMLQKTFGGVLYEVDTAKGMAAAKAARVTLREPRYEVERIRKGAKAPLIAIGKRLDAEAQRITTEILKLEEPIDQQIKSEEDRKERERLEKAAAEQKRIADIQARIAAFGQMIVNASGKTPAVLAEAVTMAEAIEIDASFAEFTAQATDAKAGVCARLREMHRAALEHEAEQARIVAERAELARLRAEQEQREAAERERAKVVEREAAAERDRMAEALRQQEASAAAERNRIAAEEQAAKDRIAALERQAREANEARERTMAAERAELERQQEALRKAREPAPAVKRPDDTEIVAVLAAHYSVSSATVIGWLSTMNLSLAA